MKTSSISTVTIVIRVIWKLTARKEVWTTCHSCELHVMGEASLSTGAYFKCNQSFYRWIWGLMAVLSLLSLLTHIWSLAWLVMPCNEATGSIPTLLVYRGLNPKHCSSLPFIHLSEERHYESTASYSRTQCNAWTD